MNKLLAALLLVPFFWITPASAKDPVFTIYVLGNNRCGECQTFALRAGRFYDETKWAKIAKLESITLDPRAPQLLPPWYRKAFAEGRTSDPTPLPAFIIWAKTTAFPKDGREIARFNGFIDIAGWYESLEVLLDSIKHRMKDGVFQEYEQKD